MDIIFLIITLCKLGDLDCTHAEILVRTQSRLAKDKQGFELTSKKLGSEKTNESIPRKNIVVKDEQTNQDILGHFCPF